MAELLATVCTWPHIWASTATKILHKKRRALIPVLDNLAIFGAYMKRDWPEVGPSADSIGDKANILQALNSIFADLVRPENTDTWQELQRMAKNRRRIEVFDMVWWIHFKRMEKLRAEATKRLQTGTGPRSPD